MGNSSRRKCPLKQPAAAVDPAPPPLPRENSRATAVVLLAFALVFTALAVVSYRRTSATWDEPIHLTDGYVTLVRHDYRVDPEHPPLLRMWSALPLLAIGDIKLDTSPIDRTEPNVWALTTVFGFTHAFLYDGNDADRLLYAARFMTVVAGVVLGALIFFLVREWFGFPTAVVALAFYTLEPNLLAHGSLVTTDFGAALFIFATVYCLWRFRRRPTAATAAWLTLSFALGIVSKFTVLILVPIVLILLVGCVWTFRTLNVRTAIAVLALLAAASYVAIWANYGFRYAPGPSSSWLYHFQDNRIVRQQVPRLASIVAWVDSHHLVPNVFSQGFLLGQAKAQVRPAFVMGKYSAQGWWYYFPLAFAIKTPLSAMVLALLALIAIAVRPRADLLERAMFLIFPVAVYMAFAINSHMNIGLRHILPIYPFLIVLAAAGAHQLLAWRRPGAIALAVLGLFWVVEFGRAYPSVLAFFNVLVGGPRNGYRYLADSNVDWGQDLKGLKAWMDRNHVSHIDLAYFGNADPAYYGIDCAYLPPQPDFAPKTAAARQTRFPGYVAVSATSLDDVYTEKHDFYEPLRYQAPVAIIGNSIFVYWVERPWWY